MNFIIILTTVLFSIKGFGDIIAIEGKPYEIRPTQLNFCGEEGDPAYQAAIFVISSVRSMGEAIADASCKAGKTELCSADGKTKFWMELLFQQIRKYPSRYRSTGCASLRNKCEILCENVKIYSKKDCDIECNQYEFYNR